MQKKLSWRVVFSAVLILLVGLSAQAWTAQTIQPIVYTIKVSAPETHYAEVEVIVPAEGSEIIEMMMPVWSPGFYRVQDYASKVEDLSASTPDGSTLQVDRPKNNRWRIQTSGTPIVVLSYRLFCNSVSVTTNWIGDDLAVLNGPATFITLVEQIRRPHEVRIELPEVWEQVMTSLNSAPDGLPNHFRADDYDILVDSPIVAGNLIVNEFEVDGSKHYMVDAGDIGQWDSQRAAQDLEKIVQENRRFWGFLPYDKYVFLNVFRRGGGGLEHKNSTLLTASSARSSTPSLSWLMFVSHEYFHAFNVKRLRPVELGPFDYENPPRTSGLWISEGLTTYYGDLLVIRSGLCSPQDFLSRLSSNIERLQNTPGRLVQTLEQSSLDVWTSGMSGIGGDNATTVSYYVKGAVVGFLLDAKIQSLTGGMKSLDDVMRLAYQRYSGERGFTQVQFNETAEEVAGVDLKEWFRIAVSSSEELDYAEALDWFGLRFAESDVKEQAGTWKLEILEEATESQKNRLQQWLGSDGNK
ncbi:hypothetical protein AMJ80_10160 [bacterium SM23_31]|nr:MAG: hypothetical protein AMJ80_10160 [bacterium SM23_31]